MGNGAHDALFKAIFSQPEHAAGELSCVLPPALVAQIDFSTLTLLPGSFVDEALGDSHADLLYAVRMGGREALLYLLFEHQSTVDAWMPFRLLRYMVRIWETFLKTRPGASRLPVLIPVVLHHSEAGWTADTTFETLLDADASLLGVVGEHVPRFRFVLDDLGARGEEAIRSRAMSALGRIALVCLLRARDPDELFEALRRLSPLVLEVFGAANGRAALASIWRYVFMTGKRMPAAEFVRRLVGAIGEELRRDMMTLEEMVAAQQREWGIEIGIEKGQRAMLVDMLSDRFGTYPEAVMARIEAAGLDDLKRWARRLLKAPTLEDVFADG